MGNENFINESKVVKEIIENSKDEGKAIGLIEILLNEFSNSKFKRKPVKLTETQLKTLELVEKKEISIKEATKILNISRTTYYKYKKIKEIIENDDKPN